MAEGSVSGSHAMPGVRHVTELEADYVTELFTLAFHDDPTWGWAFPDAAKRHEHHRLWWGLYMHSAVPYGWVWMTDDGGAASLWIPPEKPELSEEDEARMEPLLRQLLGSHAPSLPMTCWSCSIASRQPTRATRRTTTSACLARILTMGLS
jgi:hypothetical protein